MPTEPEQLIALPLLIIVGFALIVSVWIAGNGGDVTWITSAVEALAVLALLVGFILAGRTALKSAV